MPTHYSIGPPITVEIILFIPIIYCDSPRQLYCFTCSQINQTFYKTDNDVI